MRKTGLILLTFIIIVVLGAGGWYLAKPLNPWGIGENEPAYLVVDRSQYTLYFLERGRIKRSFPVVIGKAKTRTPLGTWRVGKKLTFEELTVYGYKKLQLDRLEGKKFTPTIYAVHGTNEEQLLMTKPRMHSNGCVRLYNKDIAWLWPRVAKGTPVEVVP